MADNVIVEFLVRQPGAAARLLAEHVDDGSGHCRKCIAQEQGARDIWPCRLYGYASAADEVERRRDPVRRRST